MTGTLWRIARRSAWTSKKRSLLVVALIALAVAVAVAVAVGARSSQTEPADDIAAYYGAAELRIERWGGNLAFADLPPELQAYVTAQGVGERVQLSPAEIDAALASLVPQADVHRFDEAYVRDRETRVHYRLLTVDPSGPLAEGMFVGDPPRVAKGEALLTPHLLKDLGVSVGDDVTLADVGTFRVAAAIDPQGYRQENLAIVPGLDALPDGPATTIWLVGITNGAIDMAVTQRLESVLNPDPELASIGVSPRPADGEWYAEPDSITSQPPFIGAMVGVVLLAQVALVASAAFATGTRRRLREFGLLAAGGAAPGHIRGLVLREAGVLGAIGALLGIALGVVAAFFSEPLVESFAGRVLAGLRWHPLDLIVPALVGFGAAFAAAYQPARTVSRVPVTAALAGRAPLGRVPRWVAPGAIAVSAAGLLLLAKVIRDDNTGNGDARLLLVMVASALAIGGAAALAVPIVGWLGRVADRLPLRPRLVARDAVRQRTRSAAAVAALTVVFTGAVVVATIIATETQRDAALASVEQTDAKDPLRVRPDLAVVEGAYYHEVPLLLTDGVLAQAVAEIDAEIGVDQVVRLAVLVDPAGNTDGWLEIVPPLSAAADGVSASGRIGVLTPELAALLGAPDVARGEVLVADPWLAETLRTPAGGWVHGETITLVSHDNQGQVGTRVELPLAAGTATNYAFGLPELYVTAETASDLGLTGVDRVAVLDLAAAPPAELVENHQWNGPRALYFTNFSVGGTEPIDEFLPTAIAVGIALIIALIITAMTTALAATESDRDLELVTAVGAEPRLRRSFHGLQAGYHALIAAVVAAPLGLLLVVAVRADGPFEPPTVVPWLALAAIVVATPVIIGAVFRVVTRSSRVAAPARRIA